MTAGIFQSEAAVVAKGSRGSHGYGAVVLSLLGGLILETWYMQVDAGVRPRLVTGVVVLAIAALGLRRWWMSWPFVPGAKLTPREFATPHAPWCLLLLVTGSALPLLLHVGSFTLVFLSAAALGFIPWSKVAFYRAHPIVSATIFFVGATAALLGPGAPGNWLIAPVAAWALWVTAIMLLLVSAKGPAARPASTASAKP